MMPIWTISLRFFSPPEKADIDRALEHFLVHAERIGLGAGELEELAARQRRLAARAALRIERLAQELDVGDAGDLDRILEAEEQALPRRARARHFEQVLAAEGDAAAGRFIARAPAQHIAERRLAGAVGAHDRVHSPAFTLRLEPLEDFLAVDFGAEVGDLAAFFAILVRPHRAGREHRLGLDQLGQLEERRLAQRRRGRRRRADRRGLIEHGHLGAIGDFVGGPGVADRRRLAGGGVAPLAAAGDHHPAIAQLAVHTLVEQHRGAPEGRAHDDLGVVLDRRADGLRGGHVLDGHHLDQQESGGEDHTTSRPFPGARRREHGTPRSPRSPRG
jgi:hypothetical protein